MNVAILDDNHNVLQSIKASIQCLGHTPDCFRDPNHLLPHLQNSEADLLIIDQMLESPKSGWDLICEIREQAISAAPVILITGYSEQELGDRVTATPNC